MFVHSKCPNPSPSLPSLPLFLPAFSTVMDFDSTRIFYSDQSLLAPPPDFTDPFSDDDVDDEQNEDPNNPLTEEQREAARKKKEDKKFAKVRTRRGAVNRRPDSPLNHLCNFSPIL
jgi:hypothetical protein